MIPEFYTDDFHILNNSGTQRNADKCGLAGGCPRSGLRSSAFICGSFNFMAHVLLEVKLGTIRHLRKSNVTFLRLCVHSKMATYMDKYFL